MMHEEEFAPVSRSSALSTDFTGFCLFPECWSSDGNRKVASTRVLGEEARFVTLGLVLLSGGSLSAIVVRCAA